MATYPAGKPARMSRGEFRQWMQDQPESARCERVAGEPVAMAPERIAHVRLKARIWRALDADIRRKGFDCEALSDGVTIEIGDDTDYEPDAVVNCGPLLPDDALAASHPVVVVEVLSPGTRARDAGAKLDDYFRVPSIRHYVLVKTERRSVIHHRRSEAGGIETFLASGGILHLNPPGIDLDLDEIYGPADG
jgi:Uma2 family endonuclease